MIPILTHLARSPRWHTIPEIAAAAGILPIQARNRLDAFTVARLVEWQGDTVALRHGWIVRDRFGPPGVVLNRGDALALARVLGGVVERAGGDA